MVKSNAATAIQSTDPEPEQLGLRLFAWVGQRAGIPPERALWRVLLDMAIGAADTFHASGRKVAASAAWSVGLTLYMRADAAGIIEGFSIRTIAQDCRLNERTVRGALSLMRRWRVVKMERPSRRGAAIWRMNLGGLDWPVVRARAERAHGEPATSAGTMPPLSAGTMPALKGYSDRADDQIPHAAAAEESRAPASADGEQQQQLQERLRREGETRDQRRAEGLIAACCARARQLGEPLHEQELRKGVADGVYSLETLQEEADRYGELLRKRGGRR